MKVYFAGPLFTSAEREWNEQLRDLIVAGGHEVFLPQDQEVDARQPDKTFRNDVDHLEWADALVAIMDGEDPDSGTAFECGWAYAKGKPIICLRTDFRQWGQSDATYNLMLTESATIRLDLITAPMREIAPKVLAALASLKL